MNFLKALIAPVFDLILKALAALFLIKQGEKNERAKQSKKTLENIDRVNRARRDDSKRDRVRNKYRRD